MKRKHCDCLPAVKARAAPKAGKMPDQMVEQFDVHPSQINQWRRQLLDVATSVLSTQKDKIRFFALIIRIREIIVAGFYG